MECRWKWESHVYSNSLIFEIVLAHICITCIIQSAISNSRGNVSLFINGDCSKDKEYLHHYKDYKKLNRTSKILVIFLSYFIGNNQFMAFSTSISLFLLIFKIMFEELSLRMSFCLLFSIWDYNLCCFRTFDFQFECIYSYWN